MNISSGVSMLPVRQAAMLRFGDLNPERPTLFTDLDGTWGRDLDGAISPERRALQSAVKWMPSLQVVYITARPATRVMSIEDLSEPAYSIVENGSYIYEGLPTPGKKPDAEWQAYLLDQIKRDGFKTETIDREVQVLASRADYGFDLKRIEDLYGAEMVQKSPFQSVFLIPDAALRDEATLERFKADLGERLKARGIERFVMNSYPFHGKPFTVVDVMTPAANKGDALDFLKEKYSLKPHMITVAADGGNDGYMMAGDGRYAIIVGPNQKLREAAQKIIRHFRALLQPPDVDPSQGVRDGLKQAYNAMLWEEYHRAQDERDARRLNAQG